MDKKETCVYCGQTFADIIWISGRCNGKTLYSKLIRKSGKFICPKCYLEKREKMIKKGVLNNDKR